jgi:hypothetical protein
MHRTRNADMPGQRRPEDRFQSRGRAPVARQPHKLEEVGSIPTPGTISCSPVAQIEERPILTREVDGASPSGAATFMEVKADERAAAGWKPDGAATAACGACPLTSALGRKHCSDAAVS